MGLFDALPPAKSGGAAKRPLEQSGLAAGDSAKMARADEPSATGPQATAAAQAAAAAAPPPRQPCVRLEAAYSEDKGSRLTMEGVTPGATAISGGGRSRMGGARTPAPDADACAGADRPRWRCLESALIA